MGLDSCYLAAALPWKKRDEGGGKKGNDQGNYATWDDATIVTSPFLIISPPHSVPLGVVLSGLDDLHNEQSLRNDHLLTEP